MALRLILMGVVAGMGMSLPTSDDVVGWCGAAESWVNARFDDWDARMSGQGSAVVLNDEATAPCTPAPEPSDEQFDAVMSNMTAAFVKDMAPAAIETPVVKAVETPVASPVEVQVPAEAAKVEVIAVVDPDAAFNVVMEETVGAFKADLASTARDGTTKMVAAAEVVEKAVSEPASAPAPALVPQDVPVASATMANPAPQPSREAQAGGEDRLEHAMRLTREAVFAWAGLLHGPAFVTIPR